MNKPETAFTGKQAADIVGITYRQLDYWARTDLVRPSLPTPRVAVRVVTTTIEIFSSCEW